ncbi:MAG: AmmeMemoRadiSam system protein A [Candidatus Aenigmarchaeota archaeon]|nr:AmmeMemoRadiSam system protein A [Candidatus Aenigmarchaeota archaeon]
MGVMRFMNEYKKQDKKFLLNLARKSIEYFLEKRELLNIENVNEKLKQKKGVFVTLEKNGMLRGCIGTIQPIDPLYIAVIKNAVSAAFYDPRFHPVEYNEMDDIGIEISILTEPKKIIYKNVGELLRKIKIGKDGLIIKSGFKSATFLPQVWEKIPDKKLFLSELCLKANLPMDEWKKSKLEIFKYNVISFKE